MPAKVWLLPFRLKLPEPLPAKLSTAVEAIWFVKPLAPPPMPICRTLLVPSPIRTSPAMAVCPAALLRKTVPPPWIVVSPL